jgi:hypothetical protein
MVDKLQIHLISYWQRVCCITSRNCECGIGFRPNRAGKYGLLAFVASNHTVKSEAKSDKAVEKLMMKKQENMKLSHAGVFEAVRIELSEMRE